MRRTSGVTYPASEPLFPFRLAIAGAADVGAD
jgi:hypothetical protein